MRTVSILFVVCLAFCLRGVSSWPASWSPAADSEPPHRLSASATHTQDDAPLVEDMNGLMEELQRISEWNPMDSSGSTGTSSTTTTTTSAPSTTTPSPFPPAVSISINVSSDASITVANTTWLNLFTFQLATFLSIPTSRIAAVNALTVPGSGFFLSVLIVSSSSPTDPSPATLAQNLQNSYSQFLALSSVQYVQAVASSPPTVTNLFQCPDGTFQVTCPLTTQPATTVAPTSSSSSGIQTFWFYVIGIGAGVGLIVIGTVVYFGFCRTTDSRLKTEEFRGVELQYEAPFSTSGAPIVGSSAAGRQQGMFEEVTLHELEAQQAQQDGVRKRDISVG